MKAKNWQETKSMSVNELQVKLNDSREQLFRLKFRHASTPLKNGLEIRNLRKMVARIETLLRERQLAEKKS